MALKCQLCENGTLELVEGHEPWCDTYYQCDLCDSTFPLTVEDD